MARAAHARHSAVPLAGAIAVVMLGGLGAGYALLTSGPSHPDHPAAGPAAPSSSATPSPTVGATVAEATAPGPAETTAFPSSDKPPRHRPQSTSSAVQGQSATGPSLVTVPGHLVTRHVLVPGRTLAAAPAPRAPTHVVPTPRPTRPTSRPTPTRPPSSAPPSTPPSPAAPSPSCRQHGTPSSPGPKLPWCPRPR